MDCAPSESPGSKDILKDIREQIIAFAKMIMVWLFIGDAFWSESNGPSQTSICPQRACPVSMGPVNAKRAQLHNKLTGAPVPHVDCLEALGKQ